VIGLAPDLIWRFCGQVAEINRDPAKSDSFDLVEGNPIESLRALMAESTMQDTGGLPRWQPACSAISGMT
jgi:anthranilate synthase component 1